MSFELNESFTSNKSNQDIMKIALEIVEARKGRILQHTQKSLKVKFGSKIKVRLFGVGMLRKIDKTQLPTILNVEIEPIHDEYLIDVSLIDNLGYLIYRDPISKSLYHSYFSDFLGDIKQGLTGNKEGENGVTY